MPPWNFVGASSPVPPSGNVFQSFQHNDLQSQVGWGKGVCSVGRRQSQQFLYWIIALLTFTCPHIPVTRNKILSPFLLRSHSIPLPSPAILLSQETPDPSSRLFLTSSRADFHQAKHIHGIRLTVLLGFHKNIIISLKILTKSDCSNNKYIPMTRVECIPLYTDTVIKYGI